MSQRPAEKGLDQENWSNDGEFVHCKQNDCHFYKRKRGEKRRLLCRFFPDRIEFKCDSCRQKSTFYFEKSKNFDAVVDKNVWIPLKSLLDLKEWNDGK